MPATTPANGASVSGAASHDGGASRFGRLNEAEADRVVILHDRVPPDAPPDQQDTLDQAAQVAGALRHLGYRVDTLPLALDLAGATQRLRALRPVAVFNLAESLAGDGGLAHLPAQWLESLRLPYTGCSGEALYLTARKPLAKRLLRAAGLPTPDWYPDRDVDAARRDAAGAWLVKSVCEEASIGLDAGALVDGLDAARARIADCARRYGGEWLAERYVDGRELNVGLLAGNPGDAGDPLVLPIAEMEFVDYGSARPRIVDYAAKWDPDSFGYTHTRRRFDLPVEDAGLVDELARLARACWKVFGLRGYARVDFRVDAAGRPWILEINSNPCIAADAGFTAAAARAGLDLENVVARLLAAAVHA